ncbi:MAG: BatD family protein, partial [Flavobacteriales bacterium]|nr:BatD family protein [Flavobacteriales bacterium]
MGTLRHLLIVLGCVLVLPAAAQEITFQATVDRNAIATGEHVRLTITLTNARGSITAPDFDGLVTVQGPHTSTRSNVDLFTGRGTSVQTAAWVLTATKPGTYTIGPATVKVGGGVIRTEPITIEVVQGEARTPDSQAARGQQRDANLFATVSLSRNKAYVGEQVIATYTLYSRYTGVELTRTDMPRTNGFWAEEVDMGERTWEDRLQTINGLQYRVAVLRKQVLIPQRPGQLTIEPMKLTCVVGRSFFNRGQEMQVMSNDAVLTAVALPTPAPPGFNGAVGEVQVALRAERRAMKANEAVEVGLRISGRSNLKLIEAPPIDFPPDMEVYDPKTTDKITVNGGGMSGAREFQYLAIPRYAGTYTIGPVPFTWFDPKAGTYRTAETDAITIEVAPGEGAAPGTPQRPGKMDVQMLDTDIRYLRTGDLGLRARGRFLFGSLPWVAGVGAPALAFALFMLVRHRRRAARADVAGMRRRRADRIAAKRLKEADDALRA